MIKNSRVRFNGTKHVLFSNFTKHREYTVLAGVGDGLPRNDGLTGAYITSDTLLVVKDDAGLIRHLTFNPEIWELVYEAQTTWVPKKEVVVFHPSKHAVC